MEIVRRWPIIPKIRFIDAFYDHPDVIKAYAAQSVGFDLGEL